MKSSCRAGSYRPAFDWPVGTGPTFHINSQQNLMKSKQKEIRSGRSAIVAVAIMMFIVMVAAVWIHSSGAIPHVIPDSMATLAIESPKPGGSQAMMPTTAEADINAAADVAWLSDYDEAIAESRTLKRPVLIDFAASWCVPCRMMDKHVWPDSAVQQALQNDVVPLRLDMDAANTKALVKKFNVEFVPTILLVDADGKELQRSGFVDAEGLLDLLAK